MKLKKIIEPQGRAGEVDEEPCEARKKKSCEKCYSIKGITFRAILLRESL